MAHFGRGFTSMPSASWVSFVSLSRCFWQQCLTQHYQLAVFASLEIVAESEMPTLQFCHAFIALQSTTAWQQRLGGQFALLSKYKKFARPNGLPTFITNVSLTLALPFLTCQYIRETTGLHPRDQKLAFSVVAHHLWSAVCVRRNTLAVLSASESEAELAQLLEIGTYLLSHGPTSVRV
jgi:hypothetical protein